ncbi:MAG: translation initiation factor IF-2 [Candidatus Paceibacterota bacterium]
MKEKTSTTRPPVIAVMGHIDHGKSTLLDYIRKTNVAADEAGGITQHLSAYEIHHQSDEADTRMTFLDTPGHEAFVSMRKRGAGVADIGILVVAADDGVQEQTVETIRTIKEQDIPYIVAINKIDLPGADTDKVIQQLIEHEVYVEGHGGDISYMEISAENGTNIDELLDLIALNAEILDLSMNKNEPASGIVIESSIDSQRGTQATLLLTNGTLKSGMHIHAAGCLSPVRIFENFLGEPIKEAIPSSPVRIVGFDNQPPVGSPFESFRKKKDARDAAETWNKGSEVAPSTRSDSKDFTIPILIKTDVTGTATAIVHEIEKLDSERASLDIVHTGVGDITEDDVRIAASNTQSGIIVGFNVKSSPAAQKVAERLNVAIKTASVIYDLTEWLQEAVVERTPTITTREIRGRAKILKNFSSKRDMQVVGGKVIDGAITQEAELSIIRNETEIAEGRIVELQQQRADTDKVEAGQEFGANIQSHVQIAPGDIIECFELVEK